MWRSEVGRVLDGDGSPLLHSVPHLPSTSPQEGNYACFVVKGPQKVREWLESRGVWRRRGGMVARGAGGVTAEHAESVPCNAPRVAVGLWLNLPRRAER